MKNKTYLYCEECPYVVFNEYHSVRDIDKKIEVLCSISNYRLIATLNMYELTPVPPLWCPLKK